MGSRFEDRQNQGLRFEAELFQAVQEMGFNIAINGTEHTHPEFVSQLHRSTDQTSLAVRFQPDGVASVGKIPRTFYIEAKNSKMIEKTAHQQYCKLATLDNIVVVVFKPLSNGWCFADSMPLIHGSETVKPFPIGRRFPVDEDGWLCPRQVGRRPSRGSGTSYREIDPARLELWADFKSKVCSVLAGVLVT